MHTNTDFTLRCGDCLDVLKSMPDNHFDSLVTDPPAGISFMGKAWDDDKGGSEQWIAWLTEVMAESLRVMKPGAHGLVWSLPRTSHWTATALERAGFEVRDCITHLFGSGFPKSKAIPNGFGTALKPAAEFWWLVRRPLSEKNVAANVLKLGTGAINIDGCRIEYRSEKDAKEGRSARATTSKGQFAALTQDDQFDRSDRSHITGRFPANLVLSHSEDCVFDGKGWNCPVDSECAVSALDQQSPQASRFFYCSKVSASERGECKHPTMKSVALMRYLCRLVTPPNGVILDPFMGSGSTGVAAKSDGFAFVGIEREQQYFEIAQSRVAGM